MTPELAEALPMVRRLDCGHGFASYPASPAAVDEFGHELYLCESCRQRLRAPRVEFKAPNLGGKHHK